jgi:hypothetical protein
MLMAELVFGFEKKDRDPVVGTSGIQKTKKVFRKNGLMRLPVIFCLIFSIRASPEARRILNTTCIRLR